MGWSIHHPIGLIHYSPKECFRGYTLITNLLGDYANLVDMEGRICHRWHADEGIQYGQLLSNGHLLVRTAPPVDAGGAERIGGSSASILELDWDGAVVWAYRDAMLHHDYCRLANGNTLMLLWERLSPELTAQVRGGIQSDDDPERMLGDVVREVTPGGETVYEWHAAQHLSLEEDVLCPLDSRREWTHGNAIKEMPDGALLVSFRLTSTIGIIDRSSGAFRWKWGPGQVSHQHDPTVLENGRILLFNNGAHQPRSNYSRVIEVDPETDEITWEYRGRPPISLYSFNLGGADRLPNGNTLICEGAPGRIFEITPAMEIVWEYINPFLARNGHLIGGGPEEETNAVYKAHRYGPDYPALRGRDLDPHRYADLNQGYTGRRPSR